jgi:hypothetical protein
MDKADYLNSQEKALGKRIKNLRIFREYKSQYQFTIQYTGNKKRSSLISRLEGGVNVEFRTIVKLAQTLKIEVKAIFYFNGKYPVNYFKDTKTLEERVCDELKKLGARIRELRNMKNMDQFGVTEGGLLSDAKLSRYENGLENLEFDTIASIALGLGVDILELFYYD